MSLSRLFDQITRLVIRSAVDGGIDAATRSGTPKAEMTPEEREQAKAAKAMAQRFRQATRLGRRFFR
jgi:hypothetical protein